MLNLLKELNRLYECQDPRQLPQCIQQVLLNTIECDFAHWFDLGENMKIRDIDHVYHVLAEEFPNYLDDVQMMLDDSQFAAYFMNSENPRVLRMSDYPHQEWPDNKVFVKMTEMCPSRYALYTCLIRPGNGMIAVPIKRSCQDFSMEEVHLVEEVMAHIKRHATALGLIQPENGIQNDPNPEASASLLSETFSLTSREAEVAYWVSQGKTNQDVGIILGISPHTIRTHLQHVFEKMSIENRAALAHTIWHLQPAPPA